MKKSKKKKQDSGGIIRNLWDWLAKLYRESPFFVWLFIIQIPLEVGISLLGAYFPSALVADITGSMRVKAMVFDLAVLGGGLTVMKVVKGWAGQACKAKEERLRYKHSLEIVEAVVNTEYANTERPDFQSTFDKIQELHIWSDTFTWQFMDVFVGMASALGGIVLYVGILSRISVWILLLTVAGVAVNFMVSIRCNRWDADNRHKWWALDKKMHYLSVVLSSFESAKDVRLYHMPPWLGKLYDRELKERLRFTVRQQANYFVQSIAWRSCELFMAGAAYLYLIASVFEGRIDTAEFVFYVGAATGFAMWSTTFVWTLKMLHEQALYVEENRKFMAGLKKEDEEDKLPLAFPKGHIPEIRFQNVSFRYEGAKEDTIRGISLAIKPGENLAVVGCNGAGKSTFIKLLCGFYDPTEGEILVDGVDRRNYSRASWLAHFTGVFQDMGFFPLSLLENLVPGQEADKGRLEECLKMADMEEKLQKLPEGLATAFGVGAVEGAVEFSGGEQQKLMLARALYKQAPLMVLDEPTAALDPLMESELYEGYRKFSEDKTTVFISHRLASTHFCDRILLMENGEIAEMGSHRELLDKGGKYARMFYLQSKYYQQAEAGLEGEVISQ